MLKAERPQINPNGADVCQTLGMRSPLARVLPAQWTRAAGRPQRILALVVDDHPPGVFQRPLVHSLIFGHSPVYSRGRRAAEGEGRQGASTRRRGFGPVETGAQGPG